MATKTQATYQRVIDALETQTIDSDTTTEGAIIDTADFDMGVYFAICCKSYTDGTYTLAIEHGDEDDLSDAEDVEDEMLIYGTLPAVTAELTEGDAMVKEGVHSTKRYVRANIVSTDTDVGASLQIIAILGSETMAVGQDAA